MKKENDDIISKILKQAGEEAIDFINNFKSSWIIDKEESVSPEKENISEQKEEKQGTKTTYKERVIEQINMNKDFIEEYFSSSMKYNKTKISGPNSEQLFEIAYNDLFDFCWNLKETIFEQYNFNKTKEEEKVDFISDFVNQTMARMINNLILYMLTGGSKIKK